MTAPAPSGSTPGAPSADGAARTGRRPVVLGALGAAVLAAAGLLMLTGGPDSPDAALAAPPAPTVATAPAASPSASPSAGADAAAPVLDTAPGTGRDPFRPLVSAVVPAAVPAQPPTSAAGTPAPPHAAARPAAPVPSPAAASLAADTLVLLAVEGAEEQRTAVFALGGTVLRAQVGSSFGPRASLLLLSLRREPDGTRWTAVVQRAGSDPLDLTSGTHAHLR